MKGLVSRSLVPSALLLARPKGEMTAYPANESRPTASAISYRVGVALANNGILKLGNGALAFYNNQPSGSVHLIVDVTGYFTEEPGAVVAYHAYYPFGEEATAFNQDSEQMKFTGHERDLGSLVGAGDDLDYMHARHHSPFTTRFLSPDTIEGRPAQPQSWNRYLYTQNNPLVFKDPDGRARIKVWEIGKFLVMLIPNDTHHGGLHYDVLLKKGSDKIARIAMDGKVVTGSASKSLLKEMAKRGLISGFSAFFGAVTMFFDAAPAGAQEEFPAWFRSPGEKDLQSLAKELYGTEDLAALDSDALLNVETEFYARLKKGHEEKVRAEDAVDSLQSGSCFYNGFCQ